MKLSVLTDKFFDALFPISCLSCGVKDTRFCDNCLTQMVFCKQVCGICQMPSAEGRTHKYCIDSNKLNYPEIFYSACSYHDESVSTLVGNLKYKNHPELAKICGQILINFFATTKSSLVGNWIVTSVPLDKKKLKLRGFNQSELIAEEFAVQKNLTYQPLLEKIRTTRSQAGLNRGERQKNLTNSFRATESCKNKSVLLIDDVLTTGSTLAECTKELRKAGAIEVIWLTLARD